MLLRNQKLVLDSDRGSKISNQKSSPLPLILIILDGWGIGEATEGNAITLANTANIDRLTKNYPSARISAHGKHVGLLAKYDGNSEAGHANIGAGRVVEQENVRITRSIKNGTFYKNPAFLDAIKHVRKNKSNLHLMGMVSEDDSPHVNNDHLKALIDLGRREKIKNIYLHLFTDGRDSPPHSALKVISRIEREWLKDEKICSISGRFYAMDRINKWERIEKAYDALVLGKGLCAKSPQEAITQSYNKKESDEFIKPYVIESKNKALPRASHNDAIIFFNLRSDRARQLTKTFVQKDFNKKNPGSFKRKKVLKNIKFITMTDFGENLDSIASAYPGVDLTNTLPMLLQDLTQLYIAEREKYAHVTYFFNGGYDKPVGSEDWLLIPSPDKADYENKPGLKSKELAKIIVDNIQKETCDVEEAGKKLRGGEALKCKYDFTAVNFAAPDMVGHTGALEAGIKCAEIVDECVGNIAKAYLEAGGTVIITADHGNLEEMTNLKTREIDTEHSQNPVPFILVSKQFKKTKLRKEGKLADIAPTILDLLGRKKASEMTGKSLIVN